jgi:hypothetical protein
MDGHPWRVWDRRFGGRFSTGGNRKTAAEPPHSKLVDAVDQDYALFVVYFVEADFDDFAVGGLHGAADVLGFDRHFAVAAIDEDTERDALGATKIEETVHGGADGAAGVEDVVDEDQVHGVDAERNIRGLQDGLWSDFGEIVAIESDVERADGHFDAVDAAHGLRDALGQGHSAAANTDEGEIFCAATFFHDLMGEALQGAVNFRGGHELTFFNDAHGRVILAQVSEGI